MTQKFRTICLLFICSAFILPGIVSAVQIAKPAPDFTLNDVNGNKVRLGDFRGKVVILNFWSTTCPPCIAEIPSLNMLYHDLKGSGLAVIGISLDPSIKPVKEMAEKQRIAYPLLMDSLQEVYFDTYALFGQPVSILIDRAGMVQEKLLGQIDWSSVQVHSKIITLLKGR